MVTHPFHPWRGRRLRVLAARWAKGRLTFFCDAEGMRISLPQEWTDRGPEPSDQPLSVESLAVLRALVDALQSGASAGRSAPSGGSVESGESPGTSPGKGGL
ncbi:DUF5372 family protein [Nonomuraea rubra]